MKRFFATALAALVLAGCGGGSSTPPPAPPAPGAVTVEQQLADPQRWAAYVEQDPT